MHGQGFAEQPRLSHHHSTTLTQGAVDGLDDARAIAAFGATAVIPAGQYAKEAAANRAVKHQKCCRYRRGNTAMSAGPWPHPAGASSHCVPNSKLDGEQEVDFCRRWPTNVHISLILPLPPHAAGLLSGAGVKMPTGDWAFFARLATVMRATPVTPAMLRWGLNSISSLSTCSYCAAFPTVADVRWAWPLHWYLV